jgi:hypothetical protein
MLRCCRAVELLQQLTRASALRRTGELSGPSRQAHLLESVDSGSVFTWSPATTCSPPPPTSSGRSRPGRSGDRRPSTTNEPSAPVKDNPAGLRRGCSRILFPRDDFTSLDSAREWFAPDYAFSLRSRDAEDCDPRMRPAAGG